MLMTSSSGWGDITRMRLAMGGAESWQFMEAGPFCTAVNLRPPCLSRMKKLKFFLLSFFMNETMGFSAPLKPI